ncbi:Histidinol-phosphate aminotransferase [Trichinella spiralis]|uniref:Histidinol-phosphate aminotransferase n=1 Tax=Trichinella spiralis TaxID=6334 RepID=A0ABR3KRX5_TRISP
MRTEKYQLVAHDYKAEELNCVATIFLNCVGNAFQRREEKVVTLIDIIYIEAVPSWWKIILIDQLDTVNLFVERFNKLTWMCSVDLTDLVPRLSAPFNLSQAGALHNDHGDTLDVHPSRLLFTVSSEIGLAKCASGVLLHFTSAVSLDQ